jgi:hypothetical protein
LEQFGPSLHSCTTGSADWPLTIFPLVRPEIGYPEN